MGGERKRPASAPAEKHADGGGPSLREMDIGFKMTRKQAPEWTIKGKPAVVIGDFQPSWARSVPGPQYNCNFEVTMPKAPVFSIRHSGEKSSPSSSWKEKRTNQQTDLRRMLSPADISCIAQGHPTLPRSPVASFGRISAQKRERPESAPSRNKEGPGPASRSALDAVKGRVGAGRGPAYSIATRESWRHPGEKARPTSAPSQQRNQQQQQTSPVQDGSSKLYDLSGFTNRGPMSSPKVSIAARWSEPSGGRKVPGPGEYGGAASDSKLQAHVDSTKRTPFCPSFSIGERWEGPLWDMSRSGALNRYEQGRFLGITVA